MKKNIAKILLSALLTLGVNAVQASDITIEIGGEKQVVPQNPQRVVVLDLGSADSIRALGLQDKVVGVPKSTRLPAYLADYNQDQFDNVGAVPNPSLEKINEANPDLIIAGARHQKLVDKLKEIAPVYVVKTDFNDFYNSFQQNVVALGQIFDKEEVAKQKLTALDSKISQTAKDANGKTALLLLSNESKISVFGEGSRYGMVFQNFGFTSADAQIKSSIHGMSVGFEYLSEKNPDYLLVIDRTAAISNKANNAQTVLNNEIVNRTQAAKNNHIIYLNAENWYLAFGGLESMEVMAEELSSAVKN